MPPGWPALPLARTLGSCCIIAMTAPAAEVGDGGCPEAAEVGDGSCLEAAGLGFSASREDGACGSSCAAAAKRSGMSES